MTLLDDRLASDLSEIGEISQSIRERFLALGRYAAIAHGDYRTEGIMFTCSAFGPAIDAVKAVLDLPVIAPNEGAFDEALMLCRDAAGPGRIGLLLSFEGSVAPLSSELRAAARACGQAEPEIVPAVAHGALEALTGGDAGRHDELIAEAAAEMPTLDVLVIGQFSMARARPLVAAVRPEPVLTTPHAAARKLRALVEARR